MGIEPDPDKDGEFVIRPNAQKWKLKEQERELFADAEDVPNWRLADKSRRLLLDMTYELSEAVYQHRGSAIKDLEAGPAQRTAAVSLANLMVRSAGSALTLISCGYVPESGAPIRRCIEANLRIEAIMDDPSGQHARAWLKGRPNGTIGKLAQKYGKTEDLKLLNIYAHSDVRGLMPLLTGPPAAKDGIDLRPNRDDPSAAPLLHAVAHQTTFMCMFLATTFHLGLILPPWVHSELARLKDVTAELNEQYRPEREAAARGD
jgi:hypothetical protein